MTSEVVTHEWQRPHKRGSTVRRTSPELLSFLLGELHNSQIAALTKVSTKYIINTDPDRSEELYQ